MTTPDVTTYEIDVRAADMLAAAAILPREERRLIVARLLVERGPEGLADLFVEFIALANGVAANCRAMTDELLFVTGAVHPHDPTPANLPTIPGALAGIRLAHQTRADPERMCGTCAFRVGTPANQSPITTFDAGWCVDEGRLFVCHEDIDDRGRIGGRPCAGYVEGRRKARAREIRAVKADDPAVTS